MAEKKPQTFASHTRFDPLYHFFVLPVFAISVIAAIVHFIWHPGLHSGWLFVVFVAAAIAISKLRLYPLKVQDRVIRLEERLRLANLPGRDVAVPVLTEGQWVALRFASDAEFVALARKAAEESMSRDDIKKSVKTWRADHDRL